MEILELKDVKAVPDIIHLYHKRIKNESIPLVIDNGTFITCVYYQITFDHSLL